MPKENQDVEKKNQGNTVELSSPACLMGEVDPEYMGLTCLTEKNKLRKKDKK